MIKLADNRGFSFVEVMVVVAVIAIGFMGVITLIQRTITVYGSNQNYLEASIIAQDGLELMRSVRDSNWLNGQTFASGIRTCPTSGNCYNKGSRILPIDADISADTMKIDAMQLYQDDGDGHAEVNAAHSCGLDSTGNLSAYVKSSCAKIYLDTTTNAYTEQVINNITAGDARYKSTIFNRLIETTYYDNDTPNNPADDYLYVASIVYWNDHGTDRYLTIGTYLYDYSWKYQTNQGR